MTDPKPVGELITELAQSWDPQLEADALAVRALTQGFMMGTAMEKLSEMVKIASVDQWTDANGNYLHYFTIITESGIRIRVTVEVE